MIEREFPFTACNHQASGDISSWDTSAIPCIHCHEQSVMCGIRIVMVFCCEYLKYLVEIPIQSFNEHWIMILSTEGVGINLQQSSSVAEGSIEFAVLIQNDGVDKPI
jgi:hypothetical protein